MKTPLAWRNLLHERARAGVAVAGVAFAVILVLMQLGFFFAVERTATLIFDRLNFDLAVLSRDYLHLGKASHIPIERMYQAQAVPGVKSAAPFWVGFSLWLNQDPKNRQRRSMMLLAFRPEDRVFNLPELDAQRDRLKEVRTVSVDQRSRKEFGPHAPGMSVEIGATTVRVIGEYSMGTGFSADGGAVCSDATFRELVPFIPANHLTIALVTLEDGAKAEDVKAKMAAILPRDSQVMTRDELNAYEERHWVVKTSVGIIFGLGVGVAMIVGLAIVYQVLSSDIANRMPEYATLMAMGYGRRYVNGVVLRQALIMSLAGFVPGWLIARGLYKVAEIQGNLPMEMTWKLTAAVLLLNVAMCVTSGILSLRKVNSADPADLFV
jgi:putative ABC transport system permease protein